MTTIPRRSLLVCAFMVACTHIPRTDNPPTGYQLVNGWPTLPPNWMYDEVSAVAVDSHDHVFVLTRGARKWPDSAAFDTTAIDSVTVLMIDARSGAIISKWPRKILALPHSITVDAENNVWIADVAWHQVLKFTHHGSLLMTVGKRGIPGDDATRFNQPSDVAIAADGSFYVSDGYGNNRIAHFRPDGTMIRQWGTKGSSRGQLNLPHGIALDKSDNVYVLDRGNKRIQIFDREGRYLREIPAGVFANPQDVKIGPADRIYVASAGTEGPIDNTGVVILTSDGKLIEKIGRFGNYNGQFYDLHWVAVSSSGDLYTADFGGKRIQKFVMANRKLQ